MQSFQCFSAQSDWVAERQSALVELVPDLEFIVADNIAPANLAGDSVYLDAMESICASMAHKYDPRT